MDLDVDFDFDFDYSQDISIAADDNWGFFADPEFEGSGFDSVAEGDAVGTVVTGKIEFKQHLLLVIEVDATGIEATAVGGVEGDDGARGEVWEMGRRGNAGVRIDVESGKLAADVGSGCIALALINDLTVAGTIRWPTRGGEINVPSRDNRPIALTGSKGRSGFSAGFMGRLARQKKPGGYRREQTKENDYTTTFCHHVLQMTAPTKPIQTRKMVKSDD